MRRLTLRTWSHWRSIAATLATWGKLRRPRTDQCGGRPTGATWKRLIPSTVRNKSRTPRWTVVLWWCDNGRYFVIVETFESSQFKTSLVLSQVQSEWILDCRTIDLAGPMKWGRGSRWWRTTRGTLSWRGLRVCAPVSSRTLAIKWILKLLTDKCVFSLSHQLKSLWIECRKPGRRAVVRFKWKDWQTTTGSSEISSPWPIFYLKSHSTSAIARTTVAKCIMEIGWHQLKYVQGAEVLQSSNLARSLIFPFLKYSIFFVFTCYSFFLLCTHLYVSSLTEFFAMFVFFPPLGSICASGQLWCGGGLPVDPSAHLSRSAPAFIWGYTELISSSPYCLSGTNQQFTDGFSAFTDRLK